MQLLWFLTQVEELAAPPDAGHLVQATPAACPKWGKHLFRVRRVDGATIHATPLIEAPSSIVIPLHSDQVVTVVRAPFDASDPDFVERLRAYNQLTYGAVEESPPRRRRKAAA